MTGLGVVGRLEFYNTEDLVIIVERAANILNVTINREGAVEIGKRSRGTPRIANRLLKRVRDFAQVEGCKIIDREVADKALNLLEVDQLGLDAIDRKMLQIIIEKFGGGPVGVETLAASISEETSTIEDVYEPYLLQLGFIQRTPRGRMATPLAYQHLGIPYVTDNQEEKEEEQSTLW